MIVRATASHADSSCAKARVTPSWRWASRDVVPARPGLGLFALGAAKRASSKGSERLSNSRRAARRARRGVSRLRAPPRTRRDGARDLAEVPIAGTGDALPAARTSATLVKPLLRRTVPSIKGLHPRRAPWLPPLNVLAIMVHHVQSMRMACTRFVWTHSMHAANSSTHRSRARSLPSS